MFKRLTIFSTILMALVMMSWHPGYADQHKKEDVSALITEVQSRLNTIKSGTSAELVRSETSRIDESCAISQRLLAEGKIDEAYNEITLANLYFQMIDARIDLQKAIIELDDTKKNLSR